MSYKKGSQEIIIKNASQHNLKDVTVTIPHNSFTVVTGVSGSGKSSLIFDTLFAEGQRRYVESLSSYARQFMGRMKKPKVESISGLCPAIAIEQKVNTSNPRSTIATSTEIYDYLKLLFSKIGKTISPISNQIVKRDNVEDVFNAVLKKLKDDQIMLYVLAEFKGNKEGINWLEELSKKGFTRILENYEVYKIEDAISKAIQFTNKTYVVIDRLTISLEDEDNHSRFFDAIEIAFWEGEGDCSIYFPIDQSMDLFNNRFELDGMAFEIPTREFLSFNNPHGACRTCEGFGSVLGIDTDLVIPNKQLSVYEGCVAPWKGDVMSEWKEHFISNVTNINFPIHRSYSELNEKELNILWNGDTNILGIHDFFKHLEENIYKIQYRVLAARYRGKTVCPDCKGTRLRKEASYVCLANIKDNKTEYLNLQNILLMTIETAHDVFTNLKLSPYDLKIGERILNEIKIRLGYLKNVGLGYLTLDRLSNTLSGGESQRINLATNLGSNLTGSLYILDEPSIGLHSRDTDRLIQVLKNLQHEGNTVIVVEHDEEVMRNAEYIIDIGRYAGSLGGDLIYSGNFEGLLTAPNSLTAEYLTKKTSVSLPVNFRVPNHFIELFGVTANNLKNIDVKIPLQTFTVVTGVSGSGKTTLIKNVLYPALARELKQFTTVKPGAYTKLECPSHLLKAVEFVDQNPIGKSSRSNPVTYVKAYDDIRELYSNVSNSKKNGFKPSHFSFNVDGGRCDNCQGEGETIIEMQFMADIKLPCEVCNGKRFKKEVLESEYNSKNIFDVLELTVDDAIEFFTAEKNIVEKLKPLQKVGLGYIKLGQGSNSLSGGEAQRVKLAYYLSKASPIKDGGGVFIFDEPTTGLHFYDIQKLLISLNALVEKGNTVICIEHNLDIIKCADWIIDLGPEAGKNGGGLVYQGPTKEITKIDLSLTGRYLRDKI